MGSSGSGMVVMDKNPCSDIISVGDTIWYNHQCNPGGAFFVKGVYYMLDKIRTPDIIPDDLVHIERWL